MSRWSDPDTKKTGRAYIAPVSAVLLEYFTLVVLEGDVPWKNSFSIKKYLGCHPWKRDSERKKRLSKEFRNPFFMNEVMVAQSSRDPYFFHIHLSDSLRP